ncbi:hypothetical protein PPEP_b0161 [Pseudoalteromonas peptidolytica F12-50-A1]|uniref:Uncharacterized protein n=1 Tax=Pseudoalteromonas peptidolytica F12-50-A1 TaxID=1315280 RepID=A0A8I0MYU0_9GAMM|nr:hypothetical protein [Pseudoalteromonas peptidolytica F12-50-A1]
MDVGTLAKAGRGSGVIDKIFSPQNKPLNKDNWYKQIEKKLLTSKASAKQRINEPRTTTKLLNNSPMTKRCRTM